MGRRRSPPQPPTDVKSQHRRSVSSLRKDSRVAKFKIPAGNRKQDAFSFSRTGGDMENLACSLFHNELVAEKAVFTSSTFRHSAVFEIRRYTTRGLSVPSVARVESASTANVP